MTKCHQVAGPPKRGIVLAKPVAGLYRSILNNGRGHFLKIRFRSY